jgi:Flp pilus assembly protein TadD
MGIGSRIVRSLMLAALALASTAQAAPPPALLAFIDAAIEEGRLEQARQLIENGRALAPDAPALVLRDAELRMTSDAGGARATLMALASTEVAADAHALLALLALAESDPARARQAADRSLALDPRNARAWMARGVAADRMRDWPVAEKSHSEAIALRPASAIARNNRGYSRLLQGRPADAEADLAAALAAAPERERIRRNLQLAQALQGRYAEALAHGRPTDRARDLNLIGFAAMSRGESAMASAYFSRARDAGGPEGLTADRYLAYLGSRVEQAARPPR